MSDSHLSTILKREMDRLGLNPHSLALAAGLGKDAVRDVLRGKSDSPRGKTIQALSAYLGIPVLELLGEERAEMPPGMAEPYLSRLAPGRAERDELVRLWDHMNPEAQKIAIFMMRAIAKEAGMDMPDLPHSEP
jgi:transcriptional regulator with XRE-family HTH domain